MQLRTIINSWIKEWWSEMTPAENAINKMICELDEVAIRYETVWGVYRLESLATGTLAEKMQSQVDKLNDAIEACDVDGVRQLVAGTIRMYDALEKNALALGHTPLPPDHWEIKIGSKIYRIVKCVADARALHKPDGSGVPVLTLEELVRAYEGKQSAFMDTIVNSARQELAGLPVAKIDWKKGDSVQMDEF
jgi:hypothetical protein